MGDATSGKKSVSQSLAEAEQLKEQKGRERDARLQTVLEGPRSHKFSDYDNSPQGQKAIALGIQNRQGAPYDYLRSKAANFNWPDLDPAGVGTFEPWLCYATGGGWIDLNATPNGNERRAKAAYRTLGVVENEAFARVDEKAFAEIERLRALSDPELSAQAPSRGLKKSDRFTYRDYLAGMKLDFDDLVRRSNKKAQEVLDAAGAIQKEEMEGHIAAAQSGGLLSPIQGVTLEDWAAANAKIVGGSALASVLTVLRIEKPAWDSISAEWMARMSRDTTFAISTVYGNAFTNPNIGKFAAGGQNPSGPPKPVAGGEDALSKAMSDFEVYVKIMTHQSVAAGQGQDAVSVLKKYGLGIADWAKIGAHWGSKMTTDFSLASRMGELMTRYTAQFSKPGAGDDISF